MIRISNLTRFSLYGFLKNQQYFAPFFVLILRHRGLSFLDIGIIFAVRDFTANIFEIPSGVAADIWGRIKSLKLAWIAYIVSFAIFAYADSVLYLVPAAILTGVGEAFRSGTHKSVIFDWLRSEGRLGERTKVYGYTRSWSQIGSAVAVVLSAAIVLISGKLYLLFIFTLIPYIAGLINFNSYPDNQIKSKHKLTFSNFFSELKGAFKDLFGNSSMRWLVLESIGFTGLFQVIKPYLQIILLYAGITASTRTFGTDLPAKSIILISSGYAVLHIFSAVASRKAYRLTEIFKSEDSAAAFLWLFNLIIFLLTFIFLYFKFYLAAGAVFVFLAVSFNMWRPVFLVRFDRKTKPERQATVLSMESQSKTLFKVFFAPLTGYLTDNYGIIAPVLAGCVVSLFFVLKNTPVIIDYFDSNN